MSRALFASISAFAIAIGVGRFAYTAAVPDMSANFEYPTITFGLVASSNYAGYLTGAICALVWMPRWRSLTVRLASLGTVGLTFGMGMSDLPIVWACLRFLTGVTSAAIFVVSSALMLDWLHTKGKPWLSGWIFSGVGLGAASTGALAPWLLSMGGWKIQWFGFSLLGLLFMVPVFLWIPNAPKMTIHLSPRSALRGIPWCRNINLLATAYFFEAIAFGVAGTFAVAALGEGNRSGAHATAAWVVAGISALPSTIIWAAVARRIGLLVTLRLAFITQLVGLILPAFVESLWSSLAFGVLFGTTFVGIVSLTFALVAHWKSNDVGPRIAALTAIYGVGQVIGPAISSVHSMASPGSSMFTLCAIAVFLGTAVLLVVRAPPRE